jgi:hypothetical protein
MNWFPKSIGRSDVRTVFPSLVVLGLELIAGGVLACASWNAGGSPAAASALSDWTAPLMPMFPLTVIFLLNLLP